MVFSLQNKGFVQIKKTPFFKKTFNVRPTHLKSLQQIFNGIIMDGNLFNAVVDGRHIFFVPHPLIISSRFSVLTKPK